MAQSSNNRLFFTNKLTFGQLLTWRSAVAILGFGALIAGFIVLPKFMTQKSAADTQQLTPQRVFVKTQSLQLIDDFKVPVWYTGEINARRKTAVAFQRGGKVTEIAFDEGDYVREGQPIATMDSRQLAARIKQLGAQMLAAKARRDELKKGPRIEAIRSAQANVRELEQQLENAKLDLERAENLLPRGAVSQQEYDQARYRVTTLNARIDASNAQLEELKVGTRIEQVDAAEAALDAAMAASELAEHDLDDCTLRAPFSGTITRRMVDEGAVLDTGQPVFELVESNHLELKVGLPVEIAQQLSEGTTLSVDVDGTFVDATVRSRLLALDASTQTQNVILTLDQSAAGRGIVDSQMGRVKFVKNTEESGFLIPTTAIVNDQQGLWNCFTVEKKGNEFVARRQAIEVLHFQGDYVFVRGTISPGQVVVVEGLQRLASGQVVQLADIDQETSE